MAVASGGVLGSSAGRAQEAAGPAATRGLLARILGEARPVVVFAFVLVLAGIAMRLAAPFLIDLRMDGNTYAAMGHALAQGHGFLLPWGDVTTWDCAPAGYSNHYPPLYPAYLGLVYLLFGFGLWQTKWAAVAVSLSALAVVFATSADLFGRARAWLATGLVAVEPHLVWATGTNFSENMVLLFFAITLWAILKGITEPRYMVIAGIAAGLAYLTRAGMGPFFIIAGLGGLAWRFYYMRWAVFRNKSYLLAILIFGSIVLLWAARNVMHFGWPNWQTSSYQVFTQAYAIANPGLFLRGLLWKAPLFLFFMLHYAVPFGPETRRSLLRVRREHESALWLAVFLVVAIGWVLASQFWTYEQYDVWWLDNRRYVLIAFLPLLWWVIRHARPTGARGTRRLLGFPARYGVLAVSLLAISGFVLVQPTHFPETRVASELNPHLEPGTQIGIEGIIVKYSFYPYLERHDVIVYGCRATTTDPCPGQDPDYILSLWRPHEKPGYSVFLQETIVYTFGGEPWTATVYKRDGPPPIGPRSAACNLP